MSELSKGETPTQKNGKGGIKLVVIGIIVVIAILVGTIVVLASKLNKTTKEEPKETKDVVTAENVEEVIEEWVNESEDKHIPQYYTITQNTEWSFDDGSSPSNNAFVTNDVGNESPVYFDVIVDATNETIYSSPILELGASIEKFKLDKKLEKGDYNCTLIYHLVDENQNELTTVSVGTIIHVLN
jgi:Na+-transporting NADH:ubiquinone oxidoreductase subunit NqrC